MPHSFLSTGVLLLASLLVDVACVEAGQMGRWLGGISRAQYSSELGSSPG